GGRPELAPSIERHATSSAVQGATLDYDSGRGQSAADRENPLSGLSLRSRLGWGMRDRSEKAHSAWGNRNRPGAYGCHGASCDNTRNAISPHLAPLPWPAGSGAVSRKGDSSWPPSLSTATSSSACSPCRPASSSRRSSSPRSTPGHVTNRDPWLTI